jgi:hypothetical protein
MTESQLFLAWFPRLSAEEASARTARLDAVYQNAGYRGLDLADKIDVTVDHALEAVHNQGKQAAPMAQPATRTAVLAGKEGQ